VALREAARSWLFSFPNQDASACNGAPSRTERKGPSTINLIVPVYSL
jgi:hypothetical protein